MPGDMSDEQKMWKPHVHQTLGLNLMLCITRPQKYVDTPADTYLYTVHKKSHMK